MKRRQFAALAAASLAAPAILAQERTMKIWIGFPPGGSADSIARVLAEKMKVSLVQNVVVRHSGCVLLKLLRDGEVGQHDVAL